MRSLPLCVLAVLTLAAGACGKGPDATGSTDDVAPAETSADSSVKDAADKDTASKDVPPDSADGLDPADTPGDATKADTTTACIGGPHCPCTSNSACDSALCLETADGHVCAAPCADGSGCLPTETCTTLTSGGGDIQSYCTPKWVSLCAPCKQNADCAFSGSGGGTVCAPLGNSGSFCSATCATASDCPAGFTCSSSTCHPPADTCACSPWAVAHNATTTCLNSNAAGKCAASLQCAATGAWPTCLAATPTPETCNGKDDDCNGLTDEASDATCKDADGCTQDVCSGGTCQHLKNVVCGDGECNELCGETYAFCPIDCHKCNNGICEVGESPKSCAIDCCGVAGKPAACGDGVCSGYECGESATTCKQDCTAPCGNKLCEVGESVDNCPADCAPACGNGICEPGDGGASGCIKDCAASCGNCACEGGESATTCPNDCGHCGDGVCSICSGLNEDSKSCPADCGDLALVGCTLTWKLFCVDGSPCTTDDCVTGKGCVHLPAVATCSDGNACTAGDTCIDKTCAPGSQIKCDDGNPCTIDTCSELKGCVFSAKDGLPCSDGDACTLEDSCSGGSCSKSKPRDCNDSNPCTDDSCEANKCAYLPNAATCTDGNVCTLGEHCTGGGCFGAKALKCDDSNACTGDSCDPGSGCTATALEGIPCSDGEPCTVGDVCANSACAPGGPKNCDDGKICTDDSCGNGGVCAHMSNSATCTDDNFCTSGEHCSAGGCVGAKAVKCDDSNPCTIDSCDPSGGCTATNADGLLCADGNPCTFGDACVGGSCLSGQVQDCDDKNLCTDDACAGGKCSYLANGATCTDDNVCTVGEHCSGGSCSGAKAVKCDDGNGCTSDFCEIASGCTATSVDGLPCSDGDACTNGDACRGAGCKPGPVNTCGDNNVCTDDKCSGGVCVNLANAVTCDDINPCTLADACSATVCHGTVKSCDDGTVCTADSCNSATGNCVNTPLNGLTCDDGNPCTLADACTASLCHGAPNLCDDASPCTLDACVTATGACGHDPASGPVCNDGSPCTFGDLCASGACVGTLKPGFATATCAACTDGYILIDTNAGNVCAPDQPIWGPQGDSSAAFFSDNGDGTISDSQTKLMWQKGGNGAGVSWDAARAYCKGLTLAGYTNWRWPTEAELFTLVDFTQSYPAVPPVWTATAGISDYWSAVPYSTNTGSAWTVGFGYGYSRYGSVASTNPVRCVR